MNYISTRDKNLHMSAAQAIAGGLAPDGGLMTPERFPRLAPGDLARLSAMTYEQRAADIMKRFLDDFSEEELLAYAHAAYGGGKFSSPDVAPVHQVDAHTYCLELWHGPTCAFKDMALQMLPHLLTASLKKTDEDKTVCILVATSGDTGKAALEGFRDVPSTRILVFYPKDGVSQVQELQMVTQEGANVGVCSVIGNFDDAQTGVKRIFSDRSLAGELAKRGYFLSSANSINWGRVLPQVVYYISAYCDMMASGAIREGREIDVCVPTGNFGNILAGYYARKMGLPIRRLICASNSNNVLTDFIRTGVYDRNRAFYHTSSPSMDILISSNLERLLLELSGSDEQVRGYMKALGETGRYEVSAELAGKLSQVFACGCCDDEQTARVIGRLWQEHRYLIDPHTAVAFDVREQTRVDDTPTLVVYTASPYKFCASVLPALGVAQVQEGVAAIGQLAALTGVEAPLPLTGLAGKAVRFTGVTEKEQMEARVLEMLK